MSPKPKKANNGKQDNMIYEDLLCSTDVPASDDTFSLEEILSEYGGSCQQNILRDVEKSVPPPVEEAASDSQEPEEINHAQQHSSHQEPTPPVSQEPLDPVLDADRIRQETLDELLAQAAEIPAPPHPLSMEDVVGSTVDAVMEETREPLLPPKRGLFSRRKIEDTEELYADPAPPHPKEKPKPEPPIFESSANYRESYRRQSGSLSLGFLLALLPAAVLLAEQAGVKIPYWTGNLPVQAIALLGILLTECIICRHVWGKALKNIFRKRFTSECLVSLSALIAALDCVMALALPNRTAVLPYAGVTSLTLIFTQWGLSRELRGMYDTFRTAALDDEPPYLVTDTGQGACKQKGSVTGFTNAALEDNTSVLWQTALMPLVAMATLVFAGLSSLGQNRGSDFLLNWSILLCAGSTLSLPLCWALPFSRLAQHLQKAGCAIAGWKGAESISRRRTMILGDSDLFPPGTIQLNGVKAYGEDLKKISAYAAAMTQAAGCGLERLFEGLRRSEGGRREEVDDFGFYEEGGYSGTIHGESVLLGTASFMRKMNVRLPGDINLKTGMFLAVDRTLIAVFAVKYNASENVDFALRMMRRCRITPILASRDPNVTPALLKRKFYKNLKLEFPSLTDRIALSEAELDRDLPRALLFREGLLPYAETVAGSRRLCKGVRRATGLSLFGSVAGTILTFYLVFLSSYGQITPLALDAFLLLWTLPVFLISDWTGRY